MCCFLFKCYLLVLILLFNITQTPNQSINHTWTYINIYNIHCTHTFIHHIHIHTRIHIMSVHSGPKSLSVNPHQALSFFNCSSLDLTCWSFFWATLYLLLSLSLSFFYLNLFYSYISFIYFISPSHFLTLFLIHTII